MCIIWHHLLTVSYHKNKNIVYNKLVNWARNTYSSCGWAIPDTLYDKWRRQCDNSTQLNFQTRDKINNNKSLFDNKDYIPKDSEFS